MHACCNITNITIIDSNITFGLLESQWCTYFTVLLAYVHIHKYCMCTRHKAYQLVCVVVSIQEVEGKGFPDLPIIEDFVMGICICSKISGKPLLTVRRSQSSRCPFRTTLKASVQVQQIQRQKLNFLNWPLCLLTLINVILCLWHYLKTDNILLTQIRLDHVQIDT